MKTLGVDCAGVIFYPYGKAIPGALESLRKIASSGKFGKIYIVSRVNVIGRLLFPIYLWRLDFWKRTGIPKSNLRFVRWNKEKAEICKQYGITDFIDNSFRVLRHMNNVNRHYALNPKTEPEVEKYPHLSDAVVAQSWQSLVPLLMGTRHQTLGVRE